MPISSASRAWIEVDLDAIRRNYGALARRLPPDTGLLPMVKANGYGLGAVEVMRALAPLSPWGMGVATAAEGRELRAADWTGRVVVFMPCPPREADALVASGLEPAVSGLEALARFGEAALSAGLARPDRLPVHLEVDTGMGRFGLCAEGVGRIASELRGVLERFPVEIASTFTHLHSAETDPDATRAQWKRYVDALDALRAAGVSPGLSHIANSAAVCGSYDLRADLVRPGIHLYGGGGGRGGGAAGELAPEPVVTVRARVLDVRDVPAGTTVSYGARYTTPAAARLATLGIGYGDGLRRSLAGKWAALLGGRPAPMRGDVCMDCAIVDVTEIPGVRPGDVATLLGRDGDVENGLEEMATACGTIDYEILTGWSVRLPRIHSA